MRHFKLWILTGIVFAFTALPGHAESLPIIDIGTPPVTLKYNGIEKDAQIGVEIPYGALVKTGPHNSIVIRYPDGSRVAVGANTEFVVLESKKGVQRNQLEYGEVRGAIHKKTETSKKPHFVIRSRSAVLGVRGTEFVMALEANGAGAHVHTLEGLVDVAPSESSLMSGAGTPVPDGHMIEATADGLQAPKPFDKADYLKSLENRNSTISNSLNTASSGGSSATGMTGSVAGASASGASDAASNAAGDLEKRALDQQQDVENPKKQDDQDRPVRERDKDEKRSVRLLSFHLGMLFIQRWNQQWLPVDYSGGEPLRSWTVLWAPAVPIPLGSFLWVRGSFGLHFGRNGSLNNQLLVYEYQAFAHAVVFNKLFVEAGGGRQSWQHGGPSAGLFTTNAGIILSDGRGIDRIYIGRSEYGSEQNNMEEFRLGVGFRF